jgi:hypothetical protein
MNESTEIFISRLADSHIASSFMQPSISRFASSSVPHAQTLSPSQSMISKCGPSGLIRYLLAIITTISTILDSALKNGTLADRSRLRQCAACSNEIETVAIAGSGFANC